MSNTVSKRDKLLSLFHREIVLLVSTFIENSTTGWALKSRKKNSKIFHLCISAEEKDAMHKREDLERAHLLMSEQKAEFKLMEWGVSGLIEGYSIPTDPLGKDYWEDDLLFLSIRMPKLEEEIQYAYEIMMKAIEKHKV